MMVQLYSEHLTRSPPTQLDLIYISGLKMNVSNLIMTGHLIYDTRNFMVENSHYGWSHNAYAAIDINRVENAILDKLTCVYHADRIRTDGSHSGYSITALTDSEGKYRFSDLPTSGSYTVTANVKYHSLTNRDA